MLKTLRFLTLATKWIQMARAFFFFFFNYLFILDIGEGGRKRGKHQCVVASHAPPTGGTWPATQACALPGDRTSDPLVCSLALNPLSHTSQGRWQGFKRKVLIKVMD